jgi:molybdopterin converting factor small subunit
VTHPVYLPRQLRDLYHIPAGPVQVEATCVADLLDALDGRWPGMAHRLSDASRLRPYVLFFAGEERCDLQSPLPPDAEVRIVPAVAGG